MFGGHAELQVNAPHGRVLEVALAGSDEWEVSSQGLRIIKEELAHHRPQHLIINLIAFERRFAVPVLGFPVKAASKLYPARSWIRPTPATLIEDRQMQAWIAAFPPSGWVVVRAEALGVPAAWY